MPLIINGIILRVTPYKETGMILSLLTEEAGLVSAYLKTTKKEPLPWLEPFVQIKGKLEENETGLPLLKEPQGTRWFLKLREKPEALKILRQMVNFFVQTVEEEAPIPLLYLLFCKMVEWLENGADPTAIEGLFLLKLAHHEGVLHFQNPFVEEAMMCRSLASIPKRPGEAVIASLKSQFI